MSKTISVDLFQKEASPILKEAQNLFIENAEDMKSATAMLSRVNKVLDSVTEEREKVTKPLNEALKAERTRWKPLETQLNDIIDLLRGKMSSYQTEMLQKQKKDEAKIAEKVASGKLSMEKAVTKLGELPALSEKIATEEGSVGFRTAYSVKLTHVNLIPREYLIPDEKKILEALRTGQAISGCELVETQVPVNRR